MSTTAQTCLGHGCDTLVIAGTWKPEQRFCSVACYHRARRCRCLACATLRAERGWPARSIRIGRSVFPSLPVGVAS